MKKALSHVFGILVVATTAIPVAASIITVPGNQPTIQAGVNAAVAGDTVLVSPGLFIENVTLASKDIVILGDTTGYGVILQPAVAGVSPLQIENIAGPSTQIVGFVIEGAIEAAGIECRSSSLTIRKNHIRDNYTSESGGGILMTDGGMAMITENTIYRNSALQGGGIALVGGGADIVDNVIDTNQASSIGGGLFCSAEPGHVVTGNVFRGNSAGAGGGGIYLYSGLGGHTVFSGNLFVADTSDHGGAIDNSGRDSLDIINNTFDRCVAGTNFGGGNAIWWALGYDGSVRSNIFSNTTALNDDGGALGGGGGLTDIDYNNAFDNSPMDFYSLAPGPNTLTANPRYCSPETDDYTLQASSPCLGTGDGGSNRGAFGAGCADVFEPEVILIRVGDSLMSHVVDQTPLITWRYFDPAAAPLVSSEIEVGSDNDWTVAELWDPAPIAGPDTSIEYSGQPLLDGTTYFVRVRVTTSTGLSPWLTTQFHMNALPEAPGLISPEDGATVEQSRPYLAAGESVDSDGDDLYYQFEVYSDPGLTNVVTTSGQVYQYVWYPYIEWQVTPALTLEDQSHYWRVRASDGFEWGPWSDAWSFTLNAINDPPEPTQLMAPVDHAVVPNFVTLFRWFDGVDPDGEIVSYALVVATDSNFTFSSTIPDLHQTSLGYSMLSLGQRYWWKVRAYDDRGGMSESVAWTFIVPTPGDLDGDGSRTVLDVTKLIDILFGGVPLTGILAADVNGDCFVDALDLGFLIDHIFAGGPAPSAICENSLANTLRVPQDFSTIQEAVDAALPNDIVKVSAGTYTENVVIQYKSIVLLGDTTTYGVTLHPAGTGAAPLTILDVSSPGGLVAGFVIENASEAPGVDCNHSSVTIRKNHIRDNTNSSTIGGGIVLTNGGMSAVQENFIYRNTAYWGGGIAMSHSAADLIGNEIDSNRAVGVGGGVLCDGESSHVISGNKFRGNYAQNGGGGIFLFGGDPISITYNLFVKDTADHGGGMDNSGRYDVIVDHNTFDQCVAGLSVGGGNAIWWAGDPTGGVITNNIATNCIDLYAPMGGAIGGDSVAVGLIQIDYNAVWNNTPADYYRLLPGSNSLSADPQYCNPAGGVYLLDPLSPCVGSGSLGSDRGAFGAGCVK